MKKVSDICLILEGTYPYISGGVSTWVHQIITDLPELTFSIFFIGAKRSEYNGYQYELPPNVQHVEEIYLFEEGPSFDQKPVRKSARTKAIYEHLESLLGTEKLGPNELLNFLIEVRAADKKFPFSALFRDEGWEILCDYYRRHFPEESFVNYFWTLRFLMQPGWNVMRACSQIPEAHVYHSLCTGYAGLAAALVSEERDRPFLLSEHGIYVKERIADIRTASWIPEPDRSHKAAIQRPGHLRDLWMTLFRGLAGVAYDSAEVITSLFQNNAELQKHFGAQEEKMMIIPNGVNDADFDNVIAARQYRIGEQGESRRIGFLGRIVPIKDVKCLLRAMKIVLESEPEATLLIAGAMDEDKNYVEECTRLAVQSGVGDAVEFAGVQNREDVFTQIDVLVLTSISEGLPFVLLEAMAAEIPVVATDVGACREVIEGGKDGISAGILTAVGSPRETAQALLTILNNRDQAMQMGTAGKARVKDAYSETLVVDAYRKAYQDMIQLHHANHA